jgi:hypothetical protein
LSLKKTMNPPCRAVLSRAAGIFIHNTQSFSFSYPSYAAGRIILHFRYGFYFRLTMRHGLPRPIMLVFCPNSHFLYSRLSM